MKLMMVMVLMSASLAFAKPASMTSKNAYQVKQTKKTTRTTANVSEQKFDIRKPIKNWISNMNDGFVIGFAQGTLTTNVRARRDGIDDSTNNDNNTKMQLHFGWQEIKNQELGYNAFFTYQDIADAFDNEDVRSMRWSANGTYGINEQVYTYAGLNLNKYYGSEEVEANIDRGIGYQAGVGFKIHEKAMLEMEYLALQNEGRISKTNIDVETKGIMLKINTPFTFDI